MMGIVKRISFLTRFFRFWIVVGILLLVGGSSVSARFLNDFDEGIDDLTIN